MWGSWHRDGKTKSGRQKWRFRPAGSSVRFDKPERGDMARRPSAADMRDGAAGWVYRHARYMPRWASRMTLQITEVRLENLLDITDEDALREGITQVFFRPDDGFPMSYGYMVGPDDGRTKLRCRPRDCFRELWNTVNGGRPGCGWLDNPRVWVISFAETSREKEL